MLELQLFSGRTGIILSPSLPLGARDGQMSVAVSIPPVLTWACQQHDVMVPAACSWYLLTRVVLDEGPLMIACYGCVCLIESLVSEITQYTCSVGLQTLLVSSFYVL